MQVDKSIPSLDGYWLMSINFSWKLRQVDTLPSRFLCECNLQPLVSMQSIHA